MACTTCNASEITCTECNTVHLECHPCYNTLVESCSTLSTTATPIEACINPEYCDEGCDETIDAACVTTKCGKLDVVLDLLVDDSCNLINPNADPCEAFGVPGIYTTCIEDSIDIKALFLASNAGLDTSGIVTFISGTQDIGNFTGLFPEIGTYYFEYVVHNPCYKAQLITVTVTECATTVLTLDNVECQSGTVMFSGTYSTNGAIPTLVITSGQTATNIVIAGGVITFDIEDASVNQLVTFYLQNEVQSNIINTSFQICEECIVDIIEENSGCLNSIYVVSESKELTNKVDIVLIPDSTLFEAQYKCAYDECGTQTTTSLTETLSLASKVTLDTDNLVDGVSFIKSMDLISNVSGAFSITLAPILYDSGNITAWKNAVITDIGLKLSNLGYTLTDYEIESETISNLWNIKFKIKHLPAGEWVGLNLYDGNILVVLQSNQTFEITSTIDIPRAEITCDIVTGCKQNLSMTYGILLNNIDISTTNYNLIELTTFNSNLEIIEDNGTAFCEAGNSIITSLTAVFSGCNPATYLWSNGESTATIEDVQPGIYTVTVTCGNCVATASYEIVADTNCNGRPFLTYDCNTITASTDYDTISINNAIGAVANGQTIYIPDGNYQVTFVKFGCPDKIRSLTVECNDGWSLSPAIIGNQVCENTFTVAPVNSGGFFTAWFKSNNILDLYITYSTLSAGLVYSYGTSYSIELVSIQPDGILTYKVYSTNNNSFVSDVWDVNTSQSIINPITIC